ncbi:DUF6444 domain-containing protein [Streptomyces sp. bgisy027]|uniref:DUF6444 domain-containing protein n=1 Tax=Streptomyces sp. bgisy027 TaxID=3413770 RepID=UPI003D75FFD5
MTVRVAELERRLGRNSGNSSMPPSSEVFGIPEKKPAPKSGRERGRQPGPGGQGGDGRRARYRRGPRPGGLHRLREHAGPGRQHRFRAPSGP